VDAKAKKFTEHVIFDGRLGVHDVCIGDVDGGLEHADFFENLSKNKK